MPRRLVALGAVAAAVLMTACEMTKSSNPLSPTVAGPIPGVHIGSPQPVDPSSGAKFAVDHQPLTLTVQNATTNGVRPLNYLFEIATDAGFQNKVFVREGITPGTGKTSLKLPAPLATEHTYYWRARAQDGANTGPYSQPVPFKVFTPIVITAPAPSAPIGLLSTAAPRFQWTNAPRSGPVGAITYRIEVAKTNTFASLVAAWTTSEQSKASYLDPPIAFAYATQYFWRVRASDPTTVGPWSATQVFTTIAAPAAPPTVAPPPGGGGGGGGGSAGPAPNDAINLNQAVIDGGSPSDVASRAVTAKITGLSFTPAGVHVDFTKRDGAGHWPEVVPPGWSGGIEYTLWLALKVNGVWHTAGIIEFWNGLDRNGGDVTVNNQIPRNWTYYIPSMRYQPAPGEQVGFFVTAGDQRQKDAVTVRERSNVVVIPFPPPGGGSYPF